MSTTRPLELAQRIEASLRALPGVAGLDPGSRLSTTGVGGIVRGAAVRQSEGDGLDVALELVARDGERLLDAGNAVREDALGHCRAFGYPTASVSVRFTDIAAIGEVAPPSTATTPIPRPLAPVPAPPVLAPAPRTIAFPSAEPGRKTVLVITVEVMDEPA